MSTVLWRPLGAASDATWSLDSEDSGFEKMESGLNATAVDYARFGLLFLHSGRLAGERIVSKEWVRTATASHTTTEDESGYGFFWWTDAERPGNFYALGNYGQYIYIALEASTVIVRIGSHWGFDNDGPPSVTSPTSLPARRDQWPRLLDRMVVVLTGRSPDTFSPR